VIKDTERNCVRRNYFSSQEWWLTPIIPVLRRLRQEDCDFEPSLGYIARPYFKKPRIATWEVEIGRIIIETTISTKASHGGTHLVIKKATDRRNVVCGQPWAKNEALSEK
jgi:hypothetical protein